MATRSPQGYPGSPTSVAPAQKLPCQLGSCFRIPLTLWDPVLGSCSSPGILLQDPTHPLGSCSRIPLTLWGPAHPLLTQSLSRASPVGGDCWALPAKPRACSHAPLPQRTRGCCPGAWWLCPAPGIGPSLGTPRVMGAAWEDRRSPAAPGQGSLLVAGREPEPGSDHQPNTCGHTEAPQPQRLGSVWWARGARGWGTLLASAGTE